MFALKRAYEEASPEDGSRFLVERLWPRGVKKDNLRIDGWLKDVAPSTALRRWFGHDPERFDEFRARYREELEPQRAKLDDLRRRARKGRVTLLYAARDRERNNAEKKAAVAVAPSATAFSSGG